MYVHFIIDGVGFKTRKKIEIVLNKYASNFNLNNNIWHSNLPQETIFDLKTELSKIISKNITVSCFDKKNHEIWSIGKKEKHHIIKTVDSKWKLMKYIRQVCAISALFHDWGKFNNFFQNKLKNNGKADPIRHEYISCKIIEALTHLYGKSWIDTIINGKIDTSYVESYFEQQMKTNGKIHIIDFSNMDIFTKICCYFVLSHHKLPTSDSIDTSLSIFNFDDTLSYIGKDSFGFNNTIKIEELKDEIQFCFTFGNLNFDDDKVSHKHEDVKNTIKYVYDAVNKDIEFYIRLIKNPHVFNLFSMYVRSILMLSDFNFSSIKVRMQNKLSADESTKWANTVDDYFNQTVIEHLCGVKNTTLKITDSLEGLLCSLPKSTNESLENKSNNKDFLWQDTVANKIKEVATPNSVFFVVNMASTGKGKTKANAKIMHAINPKMRYSLLVGLKQLVLQTGNSYQSDLVGFKKDDISICIGDDATKSLYDDDNDMELMHEQNAFEKHYNTDIENTYLDSLFGKKAKDKTKYKNFLAKPILVCTIDYLMRITQVKKGHKYILPFLRLLTGDLVIDEIVDFSQEDMEAIKVLVYFAGMCGKNIVISSATLTEDIALAFQEVHRDGISVYNNFFVTNEKSQVVMACDEYGVSTVKKSTAEFVMRSFISKRITLLNSEKVKIKAEILPYYGTTNKNNKSLIFDDIYHQISDGILLAHEKNHLIDKSTSKNVSFGCVRIANVNPCVLLSFDLIQRHFNDTDVYILPYHSRQILIMRYKQEKRLNNLLNRKNQPLSDEFDFNINQYNEIYPLIQNSMKKNIIFVLVATSIEEIGRDHDFDWAIVEPSSNQSLVQMAGRVKRHRKSIVDAQNSSVFVLQYNIAHLMDKYKGGKCFVFPGVESTQDVKMITKDVSNLIDNKHLQNLNSTLCIEKPKFNIVDGKIVFDRFSVAEHYIYENLHKSNTTIFCGSFQWYRDGFWFLSGIPQTIIKFRRQDYTTSNIFIDYNYQPKIVDYRQKRKIVPYQKVQIHWDKNGYKNLWFYRSYTDELEELQRKYPQKSIDELEQLYGVMSIIVPDNKNDTKKYCYHDDFGCWVEKRS